VEKISTSMGTVGMWLQIYYCVLNIVFCNYLTKEVAVCSPGCQESAVMLYQPTSSLVYMAQIHPCSKCLIV